MASSAPKAARRAMAGGEFNTGMVQSSAELSDHGVPVRADVPLMWDKGRGSKSDASSHRSELLPQLASSKIVALSSGQPRPSEASQSVAGHDKIIEH